MPIKPIDLQTLFSQLNQVGKQQAAQNDGAVLQGAVQNDRRKKIEDEKAKTVNATKTDQKQAISVKDERKKNPRQSANEQANKRPDNNEPLPEDDTITIKDPNLGNHIDISG